MSEFSDINDILNNKTSHNFVNESFARKPDGLLVNVIVCYKRDLVCIFVSIMQTLAPMPYNLSIKITIS